MRYLFQDYVLDADRRELLLGMEPVAVEPQVFDLLLHLIRNRDHVVSKNDLLASVWQGRIVSESALGARINAARSALGDNGEQQRFIKTLPRRGLRFVGAVREEVGIAECGSISPAPGARPLPVPPSSTQDTTWRWRIPVAAAVLLIVIAAGGVVWWQTSAPDRKAVKLNERPSVAVLPFTNMSGDDAQGYFSDGITEDIITDLSKVSGLVVMASNSSFQYKGRAVDVRTVARDLGVRYLLEGSVRRAGETLRVTAQLVDKTTGGHIWAERYDRGIKDVFAIQAEIAAKVAAELGVILKADENERLFRRHTDRLEAYEQFLIARRLVRPARDANQRAKIIKIAKRVIALDPDFAGGYAVLAIYLTSEVRWGRSNSPKADIERALALAQKAVATDDTFAPSYAALGSAYLMKGEHDKAVAAGREAIRLLPGAAGAHRFMGYFLHWAGRGDEAIDRLKAAERLDPKHVVTRVWLGFAYFTAGRYEEAIELFNRDYERHARQGTNALSFLAAAYAATGQDDKARTVTNVFLEKNPRITLSNYRSPSLYKRKEDRDRYLNLLRKAGMPE